jgi:hypothetical protein
MIRTNENLRTYSSPGPGAAGTRSATAYPTVCTPSETTRGHENSFEWRTSGGCGRAEKSCEIASDFKKARDRRAEKKKL